MAGGVPREAVRLLPYIRGEAGDGIIFANRVAFTGERIFKNEARPWLLSNRKLLHSVHFS